jgi:hypothetical protein
MTKVIEPAHENSRPRARTIVPPSPARRWATGSETKRHSSQAGRSRTSEHRAEAAARFRAANLRRAFEVCRVNNEDGHWSPNASVPPGVSGATGCKLGSDAANEMRANSPAANNDRGPSAEGFEELLNISLIGSPRVIPFRFRRSGCDPRVAVLGNGPRPDWLPWIQ